MASLKTLLRVGFLTLALTALCAVSASAACEGVGTVTASALRLRSEPSTESSILATAAQGELVVILEQTDDGWYKVDYQSMEGYMSAEYLDFQPQADVTLGWGVVKVSDSLNVRTGPGTEYETLGALGNRETVLILGVENGWYKILYGETAAYVHSDYVRSCMDESGARGDDPVYDGTLAAQIVAYAEEFLGVPYVYGANGPYAYDCSSFTQTVYAHFGYTLNRTSYDQALNGRAVSWDELQPGDLIFFRTMAGAYISHVGMYVGDGVIIHASSGSRMIRYANLYSSYFTNAYVCARRIIED